MEMEYKDTSRRGRYIVVLGLVLAAIAGGSAFFLINNATQQAGTAGLQTANIVVAVRQIPARKPIEPGDVQVRAVPLDATNASGIFTDATKVVGLVPGVNILEGQPIYANMLASTTAGGGFSILAAGETLAPDSPDWRAVAITVPDAQAVGGLVQAGDIVDLFLTATVLVPQTLLDQGKYYADKSTKITYQNIPILQKAGTSYIVKVRLQVAEEMSHLGSTGTATFSMALRPTQDSRVVDVTRLGETTNLIIERYGLPIPQTYPQGQLPPQPPVVVPTPTPGPSVSPAPTP